MYELKKEFSQREIKIIQRAKAYGVDSLSSEVLAKELFNLTFDYDLSKDDIDSLLEFYRICDKSVEVVQLSS